MVKENPLRGSSVCYMLASSEACPSRLWNPRMLDNNGPLKPAGGRSGKTNGGRPPIIDTTAFCHGVAALLGKSLAVWRRALKRKEVRRASLQRNISCQAVTCPSPSPNVCFQAARSPPGSASAPPRAEDGGLTPEIQLCLPQLRLDASPSQQPAAGRARKAPAGCRPSTPASLSCSSLPLHRQNPPLSSLPPPYPPLSAPSDSQEILLLPQDVSFEACGRALGRHQRPGPGGAADQRQATTLRPDPRAQFRQLHLRGDGHHRVRAVSRPVNPAAGP